MPAVALTPEQFAELLGAIGAQRDGGVTVDALQEVMRTAREPIPEQKIHHGISHYRPNGERAPALRWPEVWFAIMDGEGDLHPNKVFDPSRMTTAEIEAVNSLVPGVRGKIPFTDGALRDVRVVEERSTGGDVKRLLIAFDSLVFADKQIRNQIGSIVSLCRNLVELAQVAA